MPTVLSSPTTATEFGRFPGQFAVRILQLAVLGLAVLACLGTGAYLAQEPDWLRTDISAFGPQHLIALLLGLWLLVHSFRHPNHGVLVIVALLATNASEIAVRYYGLPSPLQAILLTTAAGLCYRFLAPSRGQRPVLVLDPLLVPLLLYAAVILASSIQAEHPGAADAKLLDLLKSIFLFVVATNLVTARQDLRTVVWVLVLSGALLGTISVLQVLTGAYDTELGGFGRIKLAQIVGETREPRIAGSVSDPNFYAQILVMLAPLALYRLWEETAPRTRLLAGYALGAIALAAVFTYSRGGALALALVLLIAVIHKRVSPRLFLLGILVLAPLSLLIPDSFTGRLTTLTQITETDQLQGVKGEDSSFRQRKILMTVAWSMFTQHPLVGVGAGNYSDHFDEYSAEIGSTQRSYDKFGMEHFPHSLPLEILAETGLLGMAAFLTIVTATLLTLRRAYAVFKRRADSKTANLVFSLGLAVIAFLITSIFLHGAYIQYFWLLVTIAAAAGRIAGGRALTIAPTGSARVPTNNTIPPAPSAAPTDGATGPAAPPSNGPKVAYVMSRFPLLTETFILREMLELERQRVPLVIFPLLRADPAVRHAEVERLKAPVHYTSFVSPAILAANLSFLIRKPVRYLRLLGTVLRENWGSANLFFGALGIFPKSVYFARLVERHRIAHIHAHYATHPALCALIASELTGIGFSFTVHAHDIFINRQMLQTKVRKARFVAAISEFNKAYILERTPDLAADRIKIVHCGIEPARYAGTAAARAQAGVRDEDRLTALCVASLQPYKGLRHLIAAMAKATAAMPGLRCMIIGEGNQRAELEAQIAELGLTDRVALLGGRTQDEVAALLGQADLFVLPSVIASTGQMEGIPVALMEAMASRLPVISTRISGIPELVEDGVSGLLVEPEDEDALAAALIALGQDPALRARMGESGQRKVSQDFDLRGNVTVLRRQFEKVLKGSIALDDQLVRWVEKRASDLAGGHCFVTFRDIGGGRDSIVYETVARCPDRSRLHMILKLHRPHWAEADQVLAQGRPHAEQEFKALTALWAYQQHDEAALAVPRPIGFNRSHSAVLMGKSPGEKLSIHLRWASWRSGGARPLPGWFDASGAWLAALHRVSATQGDSAAVIERLEREFAADLAHCREAGLDPHLADAAGRRFEANRERFAEWSARQVGQHCDFAPYNILAADSGVTVIDFEGLRPGLVYEDIAYFLCMAEIIPRYHLTRSANAALRARFLAGYRASAELDDAALDFFVLLATIKIMGNSPVLRPGGSPLARAKRLLRLNFYRRTLRKRLA